MQTQALIEQPHFDKCPDCGAGKIPKIPMVSPGGLNFGMIYDCECLYNIEMAKQKNAELFHQKKIIENRIKISGLSHEHMEIINARGFMDSAVLINDSRMFYADFDKSKSWMFMMSHSGCGKTTALTWLGLNLIISKNQRVVYFIHGNLIDAMKTRGYQTKTTLDDLISFDVIIIDDFFKGDECLAVKIQDQFKRLLDLCISNRKILLIGADIDLSATYDKLHDEYRAQIAYRIKQHCGKNIIGYEDLPNLRQTQQLSLQGVE